MPRPRREESILKEILKLGPVARAAVLKKAKGLGTEAKKLKARRKDIVKEIRRLEKEARKIEEQIGGFIGRITGRRGPRGPRSKEATQQARLTRYTNSIPKLKKELQGASEAKREKLLARLDKAERMVRELKSAKK